MATMIRGAGFLPRVGAVCVLVGGVSLGVGVGAQADTDLDFGNIDGDGQGSITVHKMVPAVDVEPGSIDGSEVANGEGLADVEFTIYHLAGIDLGEPAGWDDLDGYVDDDLVCPPIGGTEHGSDVTDGDGQVVFDGLDVGAYVLCETDAPEGVVESSEPFLVTIPAPYETGWLYDVHAYPKNSVTDVVKEVELPADPGLGAEILWPVTMDIPTFDEGKALTDFAIRDTFDSRLGNLGVESVEIVGGDSLDEGTHYTVDVDGQTVTVEFVDSAGLDALSGAVGGQVKVVFTTEIEELGDGTVTNDATGFVNDPEREDGVKSNEVETRWGDVVIYKHDAEDSSPLQGAIFEVYEAQAPYDEPCENAEPTGDAISVSGDDQFVSDGSGLAHIEGLFVGDSNEDTDYEYRCYVIKEVQAPAGFVTPTGDEAFTGVKVLAGQTVEDTTDVEVANVQRDVPELPLTGASGQLILIIGGVVLITSGVVIHMVRRRNDA